MTDTAMLDKLNEKDQRQKAGLETTPKNKTLGELVKDMEPQFRAAFPKSVDSGRFVRLALTTLRTVPHLLECSAPSVLAGFTQAAQLGLEIDSVRQQAFLIPRKIGGQNGTWEASFQVGYRGLIDIAGRSGVTVRVRAVHEKDVFEYADGLDPVLRHEPFLKGDRGATYAYFSIASFADERPPEFLVMTRTEIEAIRDRYGPKKNGKLVGPWADRDQFEAMAFKTVIIRQLNYMPLPVEVVEAIAASDVPLDVRDSLPDPELPPPADETASAAPPGDAAPPAEGQAKSSMVADLERDLDGDTVDDLPPPEE